MAPSIAVIVLTWNGWEKTHACLTSLRDVDSKDYRVLLVDNASEDGTCDKVAAEFPEVELIRSKTNRGVAGGRNLGLRRALEDGFSYCLLLDNDTRVDPGFLDAMAAVASADDRNGIVGAKILFGDDPGYLWGIGGGLDLKRCRFDIRGFDEPDRGQYDEVAEVPYVMGCAQMVRSDLLRKIGLLDERFATYFGEDTDLCLRAKKAGFRSVVAPAAKVYHCVARGKAGSRTTGNDNYYLLKGRNLLYFMRKHATPSQWIFFSGYMGFGAARAFVREVSRGNLRGFVRMVQGAFHGLRA